MIFWICIYLAIGVCLMAGFLHENDYPHNITLGAMILAPLWPCVALYRIGMRL